MTLARHNQLKAHFGGKATGIQQELKDAGFDIERDYATSRDIATGDLVFMQAEKAVLIDKKPVSISKADLVKKKLDLIRKKKAVPEKKPL